MRRTEVLHSLKQYMQFRATFTGRQCRLSTIVTDSIDLEVMTETFIELCESRKQIYAYTLMYPQYANVPRSQRLCLRNSTTPILVQCFRLFREDKAVRLTKETLPEKQRCRGLSHLLQPHRSACKRSQFKALTRENSSVLTGNFVTPMTVNRVDWSSSLPAAVSKFGQFRSPRFACVFCCSLLLVSMQGK